MNYLNELTILELAILLRNKEISAKELVQHYINRINQLDKGERGLNSVAEINPDALSIAEEMDKRGFGGFGLLAGIPILIKDNMNTADRMHTSAGAYALSEAYAPYDADIVKLLRAKGAILLGKTNMTEFADYMTKDMPRGYSSKGGQVKSPYQRTENPSEFSSGSAAAVSANLCTASIGTDTCNSIVAQGLRNGLVGFRPSMGSLSSRGILPISFTLDTPGTMTRTVTDAAILYSELTNNQLKLSNVIDFNDVTVGINEWRKADLTEEEVRKTEKIIKELEYAGANIKRCQLAASENVGLLMKYEFKYGLNRYLSELPEEFPLRTLKDIINFNKEHKEIALRYGQNYLIDAEENTSGTLEECAYQDILSDRAAACKEVRSQLMNIDVCIMLVRNNIPHYTGLPSITIPCGLYENGMPFGIVLTAKTDAQLLGYAYAIEMIAGQRVDPLPGEE